MRTISFTGWIANAAARFTGSHGAVTAQAQESDCSRQTVYDHAEKVLATVESEHSGGPTREQLLKENQALREENAQLWDWLDQTIEFPVATQQKFPVTAAAMGLSVRQILALLAAIMGAKAAPGRTKIHTWLQAGGTAAGRVLARLDRQCKALVLVGCLDEIFFHGRPVLVGVEPQSMVWFLGQKEDRLCNEFWVRQLQQWEALRHVVADAGSVLQSAIGQIQEQRRQAGQPPLDSTRDVFHTKHEAEKVLKRKWKPVERLWEQAEKADAAVHRAQQQGQDARTAAGQARAVWAKAEAAFQRYDAEETAWKRVAAVLQVFGPDGKLNDRAGAEAVIAAALPVLSGAAWATVRNHLLAPETLTFLDRLHAQLGELAISKELRAALVRLWWLRRQRSQQSAAEGDPGGGPSAARAEQEQCGKFDPNWPQWYRRMALILRGVVRASSAVECMNSVLRMHQCRHRTLNQGMLDLKRLYWNTRPFEAGKRKGKCPYEHLGLKLPSYDFWDLLQREMALALEEAKAQAKTKRETKAKAA